MTNYQDFLNNGGEKKWQDSWEKQELYKTPKDATHENKMYILPQLPYPSGSGLHVGHAEVYTACDIYARYQRMIGKKVLQVIGWDSFGLPAENYAIKTNVHPKKSTNDAIDNFREQIKQLGISVDWDREVGSHNPDYYKFTQWFFLLMYKRGLAYRKKQSVNWCDSCKTVLANEQVVEQKTGNKEQGTALMNVCERCGTEIIQREMEQWYLKITDYADRLIEGLDRIDWPEETKKRQKDWIGRSEGAMVKFEIRNSKLGIEVFTTRPDTLFGATYMVLAPEHSLISDLRLQISDWDEVEAYIEQAKHKTDLDRQTQKEKTGVELKGIKAINPVNNEEIPVFVADYVLSSYGTGAIMAVPAHDERDWEFAKKYGLEIRPVVVSGGSVQVGWTMEKYSDEWNDWYAKPGKNINSDFLNGLDTKEAIKKSIEHLEQLNIGTKKVQYKLRDWSVSRQRFWGAPIPMLFNETRKNKKYNYLFIHGHGGTGLGTFRAWLKDELEKRGHSVTAPDMPNSETPNIVEQAEYILANAQVDENTVIVAHSLGGPVAFRILEKIKDKVAKVVLIDTVLYPEFNDKERPDVAASDSFKFDFEKIKSAADEFVVLADARYNVIKKEHIEEMQKLLDARLVATMAVEEHFRGPKDETILEESIVTGLLPIPETDLPVLLPDDVDFKPTGESPLNYSKDFQKDAEKKYGKGWRYEPDTLDTFMCSSWYYYRYLDPKNDKEFASPEQLKKWMPVDFYLGGEEHVNGHLLYSRFFTKVLYDAGYVSFDEPFTKHRHQGLILGEDHQKMSKRWGNVINPTDVVNEFGADTLRMYEMFMGPLEQTKPWSTDGVKGIRRFLEKVWNLQEKIQDKIIENNVIFDDQFKLVHKLIRDVSNDVEEMKFNTAIAKMMEFVNEISSKYNLISQDVWKMFLKLLSPFAPHIADELWCTAPLFNDRSLAFVKWPEADKKWLKEEHFIMVIQVNGKKRAEQTLPVGISREMAEKSALSDDRIQKWLDGKKAKKIIYVKGKLVNIVV